MTIISVIIPTYMEEKYIEKTLRSIREQNFDGRIEIVVCDSYSKDNTVNIAAKYADMIVFVKERGIARGRNAGLKLAKGDIVLFVDADTILFPNAIQVIMHEMKDDVVGVCPLVLGYEGSSKHHVFHQIVNFLMIVFDKIGLPLFHSMCVAYKKDILLKLNGYRENIQPAEDIDMSIRASRLGKCKVINRPLAAVSLRRLKKYGILGALAMQLPAYLEVFLYKKQRLKHIYPHVEERKIPMYVLIKHAIKKLFRLMFIGKYAS